MSKQLLKSNLFATMATVVRDMHNPGERQNKATRKLKLRKNTHILFKTMREGELHVLLFDPTVAVDKWVAIIKEWVGARDLSVQVTMIFKREDVAIEDDKKKKEKMKRSTNAEQKNKKNVDRTSQCVTTISLTGKKDKTSNYSAAIFQIYGCVCLECRMKNEFTIRIQQGACKPPE